MSYGRGSGGKGPRSTRKLLGPGHKPPRKDGCPLTALALLAVPTLVGLAGWVAGAAWGWWS